MDEERGVGATYASTSVLMIPSGGASQETEDTGQSAKIEMTTETTTRSFKIRSQHAGRGTCDGESVSHCEEQLCVVFHTDSEDGFAR